MTTPITLAGLAFLGVLCVLVATTNGEFNRDGVKFGALNPAKRWGVAIIGVVLMVPYALSLFRPPQQSAAPPKHRKRSKFLSITHNSGRGLVGY